MKSLWKLQEESKSFLYKVNVWCLWLRGQKIHKSVRCYHLWFVIAANAKSEQSDLSLIKCFLFRYSYYLTIERLQCCKGETNIFKICVCVCMCVCVRVYIYNYPSFLPCKAYRVESTECGNSGTTILSTIEKTMFRPIACACLWSQIENLSASSSNPKANKYWEKETSLLPAHRASTTEKWRWL